MEKSIIENRVACFLVGHRYKGEGLVANYIKPDDMKTLHNAINKLSFQSIDWKKIQKRRW
jgi:hypothetical protein